MEREEVGEGDAVPVEEDQGLGDEARAVEAEEKVTTTRETEIAERLASIDRMIAQKDSDTRQIAAEAAVVIGNGTVSVDGEQIYTVNDARVGVFPGIRYDDYPARSVNATGGLLNR